MWEFFVIVFVSQAITRAETAEKALQAAEKQGRRLRDQNESMTIELQVRGDGDKSAQSLLCEAPKMLIMPAFTILYQYFLACTR